MCVNMHLVSSSCKAYVKAHFYPIFTHSSDAFIFFLQELILMFKG